MLRYATFVGLRRVSSAGFVSVCLLFVTGGSATTSASTPAATQQWGKGVEAVLPADAATGKKQIVSINSISCPSAGNCAAVGTYVDSSGSTQGLLVTESAGTWAAGAEAALPADAATNPQVYLDPVSCTSAGNCTAVGSYLDSSDTGQVLLLTETDGVWGTGVEAALPANAVAGDGSLSSVSCASPGNCSAVGAYESSTNVLPLLLTETAGSWTAGIEPSLPANAAAKNQSAPLGSVSCASPGNCTAVGGYFDKSGNSQALLLDETAGHWATGVEAGLPGNAATTSAYAGETVLLYAVSCASAGNCSAVGSYCAGGNCNTLGNGTPSSGEQGLLLTETAGHWTTGVEADLPVDAAGTSPLEYINSISCASAGNCTAVGSYYDGSQHTHLVLLTETAGHWATGIKEALPVNAAGAAAQEELGVNSVSCSSAGSCTAAGTYSGVGSDNTRPLLLTEAGGLWERGVGVGLPANASAPYQYSWVTVSCASAQNCSGAGFYTDKSNAQQGLLLSNATPPPPSPSVVPRLKGKTLTAAKRSIRSHGWSVGRISHTTSTRVRKGRIISQRPKPGTRLKHGAKISLVVSKGRR